MKWYRRGTEHWGEHLRIKFPPPPHDKFMTRDDEVGEPIPVA